MRYKVTFLVGFVAGYILGARAGRERYESMRSLARSAWEDPHVQRTTGALQQQAGHLVGSAARVAADSGKAVSEKVGGKLGDRLPSRLADRWSHDIGRRGHWSGFSGPRPDGRTVP